MNIGQTLTNVKVVDSRGGGTKEFNTPNQFTSGQELINFLKGEGINIDGNTVITDAINYVELNPASRLSGDTFKVTLGQRTTKAGI